MNKEEILEQAEKLRSLKEVKMIKVGDKEIPIDVKKNDTLEKIRRKIIEALANVHTYYYIDKCNVAEFEYMKWQLSYYTNLLFHENESLESIIENRKVKLLGLTFDVVPARHLLDELEEVDLMTSKLHINERKLTLDDVLEFKSGKRLFLCSLGKLILDVMSKYTVSWQMSEVTESEYAFNVASILGDIYDNNLMDLMFIGGNDAKSNIAEVGTHRFKLEYVNEIPSDNGEMVYGLCTTYKDKALQEIKLLQGMSNQKTLQTLIHELFHAMFYDLSIDVKEMHDRYGICGLPVDEIGKVMEEELVSKLSAGFTSLFLRNPNVLKTFFDNANLEK